MERNQNTLEFIFEILLSLIEGFFFLLWKLVKGIFSFIGSFLHRVCAIIFEKTAGWVALAVIAAVLIFIQQHAK